MTLVQQIVDYCLEIAEGSFNHENAYHVISLVENAPKAKIEQWHWSDNNQSWGKQPERVHTVTDHQLNKLIMPSLGPDTKQYKYIFINSEGKCIAEVYTIHSLGYKSISPKYL